MNHIIFDLEATSWEDRNLPADKEIIEIAAVQLDEQLVLQSEFDSFVRPLENPMLSAFCSDLTRIKQERIDQADSFAVVFPRFIDWIGPGAFTLASWGDFDLNQLQRDFKRHGIKFPKRMIKKHVDIKALFASRQHVRPCSLLQALQMLHFPIEGTHQRGIDDARNIAKLYKSLIKHRA
jgi:inhibitor of KinA sporulation pathway (predicted exonuclease)